MVFIFPFFCLILLFACHIISIIKQIQLPTAQFISRSAAAIDDQYGDGTSSICILNAEILKCAEKYLMEGVHPRVLIDGIKEGCEIALSVLDRMKVYIQDNPGLLEGVVRSSLITKVSPELATKMTAITTEAIHIIRLPGKELGIHPFFILICLYYYYYYFFSSFLPSLPPSF